MPGKRISELTALSGAASANNDDLLIFDSGAGETKRISRSQLAEGMVGDLPFQYFVGVLTSDPAQRLNGDPLRLGDTYYNSVADQISFYDGAAWVSYDSVLTARDEAEAARGKAQEWATNPEDDPVEAGQFSALHWASKSEDERIAAQLARGDAETARDKSQEWAEKPVDQEVETGQYSARHHSAKASAQRVLAEVAAMSANNAKDTTVAALTASNIYVDTTLAAAKAAGLGATSETETFYASGDDVDYIGYYRHDSGPTATEIQGARLPKASLLDVLVKDQGEIGMSLSDQYGRAALFVGSGGAPEMNTAYISQQFRGAWDKRATGFPWEINHVIWYGQSWAMGFDASPVLTNAQRHNTIAFNGGIRQQVAVSDDPTRLQSFEAAVEAAETGTPEFPSANVGETGAVAFAHRVWDLIERDSNISYADTGQQILLSAPGEGSKTIDALSAAPYLDRVYEQIDRGYALAQAAGKTYGVSAVTWMQQTNVSGNAAEYVTQLEALRVLIDTYAKSVTGQTEDVKLVTWQMYPRNDNPSNILSAKSVYDRFVVAADTYPHIICAGPSYQETTVNSGNSHFRAPGMARFGEMFAVAYKRGVLDGEDYQPLRPVRLIRQGPVALLTLNPIGVLASDTIKVATISNFGFKLYESDGTTEITISSAAIVGRDMIKLVSSGAIPEDAVLRYADTGTDLADANKWRGTIRDTAFDGDRSDRWLVAFELPFDN